MNAFASSGYRLGTPLRCSSTIAVHMRCPSTTTTDGGSADIASLHGCNLLGQCRSYCRAANICPSIHGHMHCPTTCYPWQYSPTRRTLSLYLISIPARYSGAGLRSVAWTHCLRIKGWIFVRVEKCILL